MTKSTLIRGWDIKTGVTARDILDEADKLEKASQDKGKVVSANDKLMPMYMLPPLALGSSKSDAQQQEMVESMCRSANIARSDMNALQDNHYSLNELTRIAKDKAISLSKKFDVKFSLAPVNKTTARAPHYFELVALEQALKKSVPQQTRTHGQLEFRFIDGIAEPRASAFHQIRPPEAPIIVTQAGSTDKGYSKDNPDSLEGDYLHELGHNAAYNLKLLFPKAGQLSDAKLAHDLGWIYKTIPHGPTIELLQANNGLYFSSGQDHFTFQKFTDNSDLSMHSQTHSDSQSHIRTINNSGTIPSSALRNQLFVKPITSYYFTPQEMLAEGIKYYRYSNTSRAQLKKDRRNYTPLSKEP